MTKMTEFSTCKGELEKGEEYSQHQSNCNTSNPVRNHAIDGLLRRKCNLKKEKTENKKD
jgi:hypothetical protein